MRPSPSIQRVLSSTSSLAACPFLAERAHIHASITPSGSRSGVIPYVRCSYIPPRPPPLPPHPRRAPARGWASGRDRVGRMQVHPALRVVAQPPQPGNALAVEVQLRRVLQAQHHRVLGHALGAGLPVRLEDVLPVNVLVRKEAVGTAGVAPAPPSNPDAACGPPP